LDEQKSKHVSLAQQNGFGPAFLLQFAQEAGWLAQGTAEPNTCC
jgi:hypothetical protein